MAERCKHGLDARFCSACARGAAGNAPEARGAVTSRPSGTGDPGGVTQHSVRYLFNNCRGFNHRVEYQVDDAFFDLSAAGRQADLATRVRPGDICVVASYGKHRGEVTFSWCSFAREERHPHNGHLNRVFCGPVLRSEIMSKGDAGQHELYSAFFNVNGDFKQLSVIRR